MLITTIDDNIKRLVNQRSDREVKSMSIGDLAFLAYVKKLAPFHPSGVSDRPRLIQCLSCKSRMPARTECGWCDTCLRMAYRDNEI